MLNTSTANSKTKQTGFIPSPRAQNHHQDALGGKLEKLSLHVAPGSLKASRR
jgi:hypothetical protein